MQKQAQEAKDLESYKAQTQEILERREAEAKENNLKQEGRGTNLKTEDTQAKLNNENIESNINNKEILQNITQKTQELQKLNEKTTQEIIKEAKQNGLSVKETKELIQNNKEAKKA